MQNKFERGSQKNMEEFEALSQVVKSSIGEYVETIKANFASELKQKLIVHRKNMIEAVETKCFEVDKDLDQVKRALLGA
jgi:hypothetical protein